MAKCIALPDVREIDCLREAKRKMHCYPRTGQSPFWVQGFNTMEYVKENGEWKISHMNWEERIELPVCIRR